MSEVYWCAKCQRRHKTSSAIGIRHSEYNVEEEITRTPHVEKPEEVIDSGGGMEPAEETTLGAETPLKPNPSRSRGVDAPLVGGADASEPLVGGERSTPTSYEDLPDDTPVQITKGTLNLMSKDMERMQLQITEMNREPVHTSQTPEANWTIDWDSIPEWARKAGTQFLADVGKMGVKAAAAFAGDSSDMSNKRMSLIERIAKKMDDDFDAMYEKRLTAAMGAYENPEYELFMVPKKKVKKVKPDGAKKVG